MHDREQNRVTQHAPDVTQQYTASLHHRKNSDEQVKIFKIQQEINVSERLAGLPGPLANSTLCHEWNVHGYNALL